MTMATVTSRLRITLPAEVCEQLGLVKGIKFDVSVNDAGEMILRPTRAIAKNVHHSLA